MEYIILAIGLFLLELTYFKVANRFNIIDKPNKRSSHTEVTIRGGGIIFIFGILVWFVIYHFQYPYLVLGIFLISIISFLDDIFELSSKLRLFVQFLAVALLLYQTGIADSEGIIYTVIALIIIVGFNNAVNFMDGINGITGLYALATLSTLCYLNQGFLFVIPSIITYSIIGVFVFLFFNLRKNAICFAGDVGSVSLAFLLAFLVLSLILHTQNLAYLLLFSVYGVDAVLTILHRLLKKENIFKPHRSHLYQYLANEMAYSHVYVSLSYFAAQLIVNIIFIYLLTHFEVGQWTLLISILFFLSIIYIGLKIQVLRKNSV